MAHPPVQVMAGGRRLPVPVMEVPMRALYVLLIVGCGTGKPEANRSDQRARDSAVGASTLPGAAGVRGALRAGDSAAVRNARIDSLER
jgi:hypothetical protein